MNDHYHVSKSWGSEIWFANNDLYCGKELHVHKNRTSSDGKFHYHKIKDETFYIMSGMLFLEYFNYDYQTGGKNKVESVILSKGDSFRVPQLMRHRFTAMHRDCRFIEVSTHHEDSDSYYEG